MTGKKIRMREHSLRKSALSSKYPNILKLKPKQPYKLIHYTHF